MTTRPAALKTAGLALVLAFAALCGTPGFAATTNLADVKSLIEKQDYDGAEKRVDAILTTEPDNVDALMYKGNLTFYRNSNVNAMQMYGNEDESIFSPDVGSLGAGSAEISRAAAQQVAVYFKRALALKPQRMDIQLGLCWTYANAGMKDELIARFAELQKYGADHDGLQYNMGDYARVIIDDHSFDDGIAVYREIARLYPDDGNITNDIAAMYLKHRDLDTAMKYFNAAAGKKIHDADTWQNLALLYTVTGDYEKGLAAQKTLSGLQHDPYWALYDALARRLRGDAHWQAAVQTFIRAHRSRPNDRVYVEFARALLPVNGNYPPKQFDAIHNMDVATQFVILHDAALAHEFPDRFDAAFDHADALTYYYNYRGALQRFDAMEQRHVAQTPEQIEQVRFDQAWALHALGQDEAANAKWRLLLDSADFYRKSAAAWFLANHAYDHQRYQEAADTCARVKDDASGSKYANYCSNLYDRAAKKL